MRGVFGLFTAALLAGGIYVFSLSRIPPKGIAPQGKDAPVPDNPCDPQTIQIAYAPRQSCDSVACHGAILGAESGPILRNEFRTWFDKDPHSRALQVLGNEVSQTMVTHLVGEEKTADNYEAVYARCFACHNTTPSAIPTKLVTSPSQFELDSAHEGVGCQACHGPAQAWENIHYLDCWKEKTAEDKSRFGLASTKPLADRAAICVRCHVGEQGKDVDHDLIAAGHPQMKFEMAGYHELMPAHWNVDEDRDRADDFEQQLWAAGQVASAKATLKLLEIRAASRRTWPEFSEYDCFACHHDLHPDSWRPGRRITEEGDPVALPWGVWHFSVLPKLAESSDRPAAERFFSTFTSLKRSMQIGFLPDPALVKEQARDLQADLDAWLKGDRAELETLLRESFRKTAQSEDPLASWDEVVQHYLAVHALVADRKPEIPAELRTKIEARLSCLRELLGFPEGYSSPAPFPAHSGSPDDARQIMKQLLDDVSRIPSKAN